jgi:hypothetical protein
VRKPGSTTAAVPARARSKRVTLSKSDMVELLVSCFERGRGLPAILREADVGTSYGSTTLCRSPVECG